MVFWILTWSDSYQEGILDFGSGVCLLLRTEFEIEEELQGRRELVVVAKGLEKESFAKMFLRQRK